MLQPDLEKIRCKQVELEAAFAAWIAEKSKYEILAFADEQGNIVRHYPDGYAEVIVYADKKR
ncbi:hypothetical protein [Neisseria chenwenguii]|uniref:Uncharacterized protein n=1 Tax=Neisseria chenwenguii TaxID=1853278 RepID=A0A220RZW2_9NEIS|nr:hypothetical protein [Neisseria chenwenguii]ASK26770.1 hypothetical protein BG910_02565 [Neisseria chenwenguii]ROV56433.1 hypothetical protein EGS38_05360 [Neisseria chenwenguii]